MCREAEAPGPLGDIECLANTLDLEDAADELDDLDGLARWLTAHGRHPDGVRTRQEFDLVRELRGVVRELLAVNADGGDAAEALVRLDELAVATGVAVRFGPDGPVHRSAAVGVAGVIGDLIGVIAAAMADGSWVRLKLCRDHGCRWAYYDRSRNRSGRWCSMEVCGNRNKARSYRQKTGGGRVESGSMPGTQ